MKKLLIVAALLVSICFSVIAGYSVSTQNAVKERDNARQTLISFAISKAENLKDEYDAGTMEALISNVYAAIQFTDDGDLYAALHDLWNALIINGDNIAGKEDDLIKALKETDPNGIQGIAHSIREGNSMASGDELLWAQPMEEHGQLFKGLNLDGVGSYDDEAYVSLYNWDNNKFGRYDASQLVIRIRFGTGETTAHIVEAVGSYQFYTAKLFSEKKDAIVLEVNNRYANSGLVSVFALDVYGLGEADPFPSVVERLNTTGEIPPLSTDGEKLYTGGLIQGTAITDIENKPLQGIVLHTSGDGFAGPIDDRVRQTIYWNGDGWIVLESKA